MSLCLFTFRFTGVRKTTGGRKESQNGKQDKKNKWEIKKGDGGILFPTKGTTWIRETTGRHTWLSIRRGELHPAVD